MMKIKTKTKQYKSAMALLALAVIILATAQPLAYASDLTPSNILALTNASRAEAGVPSLTLNATLSQAAEAKASDMIANDYFAHTSPKGVTPWHWIGQAGYSYRYAGENLAINYETAGSEHKAWMKSPTHRANILNTQYSEVGIAVKEGKIDGQNTRVTVVMFGQPKIVPPVAPKQEPTPATAPEAVKGVTEENVLPEAPAPVPQAEQPVVAPDPKLIWLTSDGYRLLSLSLIGLILALSALYFFYRDAIEYVALEKGLRLAFSGGAGSGTISLDIPEVEYKNEETLVAKLE